MTDSSKSSFTVFLSSLKMALATFLSRIMGLVREQVMAALFGASGLTDAFLVAYRIPNLMRDLFAEGAFSSAFVPTFVKARSESNDSARNLLWALFIMLFLITGLISLGIFVFADELILLFAPSFALNPEKFEIAVNLTKMMAPYLFLVSLAALYMGALNSLKVFFIPALAPVFFNISMISSMLLLPDIFESMGYKAIYALGIGVTVGGVLQGLIQLPSLYKKGFAPKLPPQILYDDSKKVFKLLGPGLIGFAATQLNLIVTTVLASGTIVGAVSWLSYSFRLFQLPIGILSVSIGNSNLVHFSEAWKNGKEDEARDFLSSSYFLTWLTILPAMVVCICYSQELVSLIFQRGKFGPGDTQMTSLALRYYAFGLPLYAMVKVFVPATYALDKHKMAVVGSIASIVFNIIFCLTLVPHYGFFILALGTTLSMLINAFILSVVLKKSLKLPLKFFISLRWFKLILSALISFGISYYVKSCFDFAHQVFIQKILILTFELLIVAFSYIMALYLLGERKVIDEQFSRILRKFKLIK